MHRVRSFGAVAGSMGSSRLWLACLLCLAGLLISIAPLAPPLAAQEPPERDAREEVPLEHCDRLLVVPVQADGVPRRFLVDTAATSFLNVRSFASGRRTDVSVTSWSGEKQATAKEVELKEFSLGNQTLHRLKLPAIESSRIEKACGGRIDGVIGVDLLERLGATIDLQKRVAVVARGGADRAPDLEARASVESCIELFNRADWKRYSDCVDPEIEWLMRERDLHGRARLLEFLESCGTGACPHALPQVRLERFWMAGDVAWFEYTYRIPGQDSDLRGMGIIHRVSDRWLLVNLNNSEPQAHAFPDP